MYKLQFFTRNIIVVLLPSFFCGFHAVLLFSDRNKKSTVYRCNSLFTVPLIVTFPNFMKKVELY